MNGRQLNNRRWLLLSAAVAIATLSGSAIRKATAVRVDGVWSRSNAAQAPTPEPFDLVSAAKDSNGLHLNPKWGWQITHPFDPSNPAGHFPDPNGSFCGKSDFGGPAGDPGCTSPGQVSDTDTATWTFLICIWGGFHPNRINGHVNWSATTYNGEIGWRERGTDGDYTFDFKPYDRPGLTLENDPVVTPRNPQFIHAEFDSREVINAFRSPLWMSFHNLVNGCQGGDQTACNNLKQMIGNGRSIVTGLMGLDSEHRGYSELHPVFLIAIEVNPDPADNTWLIFARNWGNEGFCSHKMHRLAVTNLSVLLPLNPKVTNPTAVDLISSAEKPSQFYSVPDDACPTNSAFSFDPRKGVRVDFALPDVSSPPSPFKGPITYGEVHLKWTGTVNPLGASSPESTGAATLLRGRGEAQANEGLYKELDALAGRKLTPNERKRVLNSIMEQERLERMRFFSAAKQPKQCNALSGPIAPRTFPPLPAQQPVVMSADDGEIVEKNRELLSGICSVVKYVPMLDGNRRVNFCTSRKGLLMNASGSGTRRRRG